MLESQASLGSTWHLKVRHILLVSSHFGGIHCAMTLQSSRLQRLGGVLAPSVLQSAHFNIDDLPPRTHQASVLWNVANGQTGKLVPRKPPGLLLYA